MLLDFCSQNRQRWKDCIKWLIGGLKVHQTSELVRNPEEISPFCGQCKDDRQGLVETAGGRDMRLGYGQNTPNSSTSSLRDAHARARFDAVLVRKLDRFGAQPYFRPFFGGRTRRRAR